jgi:perosamine synthetase
MTEPRTIPLARPWLDDEERDALQRVLVSGVLSRGEELTGFEREMAALAGTGGAVGVNSGTTALQLVLEALDIGHGDEVVTVSYTFVATLNAIARTGARARLVDIDPRTLNVDPALVESAVGPKTRAILVVHLFGRLAPMTAILEIARRRGLHVIEDACEALGAERDGRPAGGLGDAGTFGFYPNKTVATGEGGMITADDPDLLLRCRQLRNQGLDPASGLRHPDRPGMSARLTELQAALGRVQLARLDRSLAARERIAARYYEAFGDREEIELPDPARTGERIAWFTLPLRLAPRWNRDALRAFLAARGIESGIYFQPAHTLPFHDRHHQAGELTVTEDVGARCLALPLYPQLAPEAVDRVVTAVDAFLAGKR